MSNARARLPRSRFSERNKAMNYSYTRENEYGMRAAVVLLTLILAGAVLGQGTGTPSPNTLTGKYAGTAKAAGEADVPVTLELKQEGSKLSGRLTSPHNSEISEGTFSEGKVALKIIIGDGKEANLTGQVEGEKIIGTWSMGTQKGTVELKKVVTEVPVVVEAPSANVVSLTGEWDAVADAQGQPFPFALTLKVDGEKVTGASSSQLGESTIKTGTWKDGKLNFQLESPEGTITMSASLLDGKLSGEFDYAGQMQGKWVAIKKTK
jgi:hypothetical protein